MYLNSPADVRKDKTGKSDMPTLCALIEDYRSSTIFDAIGSIGGLLALLQGLHILLFGRPLFWGFAGQRLRERYHRQPTGGQTDDPSERFRMNTFLRDFVVNLGPADVDNEEDIELGRSGEPREPDLQNNRDRSHGDGEHDTGDST
ncbi:hypothetical protein FRC09_020480 [Ceratobasidium sp. 395]|nr:hypothetical protein FRC09_020480 [Ceratobasidium sp. 395]